jgi:predicted transcriptional regulator
MTDKGLVHRDDAPRTHVYEATWTERETQRLIVSELLEKVFKGSASELVMQALAAKPASRKELAEIRKLLDEKRGGRR